ncbi:MAG: hypothetical protein DRJ10_03775 [Bacteroidetes bacterium]|nr:MAG: hypothetical protein DRJ10_03775 [Bacteroidota bacterium]RLD84805.1 MAG: hypothetical protein DRJ07_04420 [Bacteroidota bacterium]
MKTKLIIQNTLLVLFIIAIFFACKKEDDTLSENFILLTNHTWVNDSLLADGVEASGPGQILDDFIGDTKFNVDGTGYIGTFTGEWGFNENETQITIFSDSLLIPVTTNLVELTTSSLKITTNFPSRTTPGEVIDVRMTFKPK